ncbi:MAG: hypothetical protein JJE51_13045 [Thermoanaerobaculia bacterium]|nr:hypothetical protein [Thermoanaerobaculia bacterium]
MARLVWFVLNDGRSLVAGCGGATRESLVRDLSRPGATFELTAEGSIVERIASDDVRDFVLFDARSSLVHATAIFDLSGPH